MSEPLTDRKNVAAAPAVLANGPERVQRQFRASTWQREREKRLERICRRLHRGQQEGKALERLRSAQQRRVGRLEAEAPAGIEAWRAGQENIERLRGMEKGARERALGIRGMLPTQEAVAGIESGARAEAGLYESATRAAGAAARGQESSRALVESVARQVEETGAVAAQTARILDRQLEHNAAMSERMKRLEGQISNLRNQ
ncbi:MAG TPA: hypothetical protein PKI20_19940 [Verrucomicrobiota bacterium]|nr:hypothetical protein [Verrucomicrobiota bacterium]HQL80050.1 hypothetical protein [Verrucomicrobiota bacterium]